MKNHTKKVLLGAATLAALGAVGGDAQAADTTAVNIKARVVNAISITQTKTLQFGSLTETGAGTLAVSVGDVATPSGTITLIGATTPAAGGFQIKGGTGVAFDVSVAAATATLNAGTKTMKVDTFLLAKPGPAATATKLAAITITANTVSAYRIGGTLHIGAGQASGNYTGTIVLNAAYN